MKLNKHGLKITGLRVFSGFFKTQFTSEVQTSKFERRMCTALL